MGCTNSTRKQGVDGGGKNVFQAITEFDISPSDDEDEIMGVKSLPVELHKQRLTKSIKGLSSGFTAVDASPESLTTPTNGALLDNRLQQTSV